MLTDKEKRTILEAKDLIEANWCSASNGRDRKYYSLTPKGKKKLKADIEAWGKLVDAMASIGVLKGAPA